MAKFYEGDKPCPGCGRTGAEVARKSKDDLCHECQQALEIGQAIVKERGLDRHYYNMDDLRIGQMTWYTISDRDIERALDELLRTFSQFDSRHVVTKGGFQESQLAGRIDGVTRHENFILPDVTFEAAKKLCQTIKEVSDRLQEERRNYQKELDARLAEQKNDIFNDGVQHGRNLLFQLNNGEITAEELNKRIKKY